MGFRLRINGAESIELMEKSILTVKFETDTPDDSNARSTDLGTSIMITGKILTAVDGETSDDTLKIARWSQVTAENSDCYRELTVDVVSAGQIVRQVKLTKAFVVDYTESYGDTEGVGTFFLHAKQKKDKMIDVKLAGGYSA